MTIKFVLFFLAVAWFLGSPAAVMAQQVTPQIVPPSADPARVNPEQNIPVPDRSQNAPAAPVSLFSTNPIPEGASSIHLTLKAVHLEGVTVFSPEQLRDIYSALLGQDVTLDVAWRIANDVTARYRTAGYFLSRAYVPQQDIKEGVITIKVVEGYIGKVELPPDYEPPNIIRLYISRLMAERPATTDEVESTLLRMSDLPGLTFRSVLSPLDDATDEAAIKLTLVPTDKAGSGFISYDNFSSRYLGPDEATLSYSTSIIPLEETTGFIQTSAPADKVRYGSINQKAAIYPDVSVEVGGGVTKAYPGYTLRPFDINSTSINETASLDYQWIRQRQENLALKLTVDNRDVTSYLLGSLLTQDHIHALRANATYDLTDRFRGYTTLNGTLSHGLNILGNSQKNDDFLSRAGALPDFMKAEFIATRQQAVTDDWSLFVSASGQWSSGALYSSEQFGYGGQVFGRAYDSSEITGDRGAAGSIEARYESLHIADWITPQPYAFYDVGKVWDVGAIEPQSASGSSAGFGLRFTTKWNETGNLGLGWPLSRSISVPIYGQSVRGPRIILQLSQNF